MVRLIACCLLMLGCLGCTSPQTDSSAPVTAPPMTPSDFYGFCSTAPTPDGCDSDSVCQRYRRELAIAPRELTACLGMCQRVDNDLYVGNLTNSCSSVLAQAQDLCDQFCRRQDRSGVSR